MWIVIVMIALLLQVPLAVSLKTFQENQKQGYEGWLVPQTPYRPLIEGFSDPFSVYPGSELAFKLNCSRSVSTISLQILRLGYYQGKGARLIKSIEVSPSACNHQLKCKFFSDTRMTDCGNWADSVTWKLGADIPSGVYVAFPNGTDTHHHSIYGGYIPFIVKASKANNKADLLFKTADLTWVAYNKFGGWNIYGGNGSKVFSSRAYKASYNRPFENRLTYPVGQWHNFVFHTEFPMLYWLEKHGYDVTYVSSGDFDDLHDQNLLTTSNYKVLLSVGHDEYWTAKTRLAFETARDRGVHLAFFSGNEGFWQIVWEEDYLKVLGKQTKSVRRVVVCRKESIDNIPPPHPSLWTGTFTDPRHRFPQPGNALTGQLFMVNAYRNDSLSVDGTESQFRFWRNTSLAHQGHKQGEKYIYHTPRGILGYEMDIYAEDMFRPIGMIPLSSTRVMVKNSLMENFGATYQGSGIVFHKLTLYRNRAKDKVDVCGNNKQVSNPPQSSLVFGAGTLQWSWALSSFRDGDKMDMDYNIQQATLNLFADMNVMPYKIIQDSPPTNLTQRAHYQQLVMPQSSTDYLPPVSTIMQPNRVTPDIKLANTRVIHLYGTTYDRGGGVVAAVEVSINAGRTWHQASISKDTWHLTAHLKQMKRRFGFHNQTELYQHHNLPLPLREQMRMKTMEQWHLFDDQKYPHHVLGRKLLSKQQQQEVMIILTRAVDDSAWIEENEAELAILQAQCSNAQIKFDDFMNLCHRLGNCMAVKITTIVR